MPKSELPANTYTYAPEQNPNIILGSFQLLLWLVFRPRAWGNHLRQIDASFNKNVYLVQMLKEHRWRQSKIQKFFFQGFIVLPILLSLLAGLHSLSSGTSLDVAMFGMGLGVALGVVFGIGFGITDGVAYGVAFGMAFGVVGSIVFGDSAGGTTEGMVFGMAAGAALGITGKNIGTGGISGGTAFGVAGGAAFGAAFGVIGDIEDGVVGALTGGIAGGLAMCINWWRPAAMAGILIPWHWLLYRLDRTRHARLPSLLSKHLAFWDEWQKFPIPGLDQHVLLVLEKRPFEGQAALEYLSTGRQRWAVQAVQIELDARRMERCDQISAIANSHHSLNVNVRQGPADSLLRILNRISVDTAAALSEDNADSQRLALSSIGDRLDGLLQELEQNSHRYAVRFRPVALRWSNIVALTIRDLPKGSEQRQEVEASYIVDKASEQRQEAEAAHILPKAFEQRQETNTPNILPRDSQKRQEIDTPNILPKSSEQRQEADFPYNRPKASQQQQENQALNISARASQQQSEIDSPYITTAPLKQQRFVGRTDISARIELLAHDGRRSPLLLYGQRRIGKSSLLNNLGQLLPQSVIPLLIDFQGPISKAKDVTDFLYNLTREMSQSAQKQRGLTLPMLVGQDLGNYPFTVFGKWLDSVETTLGKGNTVLLALDELEGLDTDLSDGRLKKTDVLAMFRNLFQKRPRFKVLIAGSHTLKEFQRRSRYLSKAQMIHLGYLKETQARQLIENPIKNFALQYKPEASQRLLDITHGHPFLVQLLCGAIVNYKNEQDPGVRYLATVADVEASIPKALESGSTFFNDIEGNQVDDTARGILRHIAAQGEGGTASQSQLAQQISGGLASAIDLLLRRELIEETADGYRFQVELIRRWFAEGQ